MTDDEFRAKEGAPDVVASPENAELGAMLSDARPVPAGAFRGALARHLAEIDPGYGPRPARLRLRTGALTGVGAMLVGFGALVATGII